MESKGDFFANLEVLENKIDENYIIATINMFSFQFAVDDIMKFIRYAEIIKPIELRTFVESDLSRILLAYKDLQP